MSIESLIDPFFEQLPAGTFRHTRLVGQFCWVPVAHLDGLPRILDVERADPEEHYATRFEIRQMSDKDYRKKNRLPIKALNLRETEELVVQVTKRRPAIIISAGRTIFEDVTKLLKQRAQRHLQENSVAVIPLYQFESPEHGGGCPPLQLARIKAMLYRQFFYCPQGQEFKAGVLRLDRIQTVIPNAPAFSPARTTLSGEALAVLLTAIRHLFGEPLSGDARALWDLLHDTLPEEARPQATR